MPLSRGSAPAPLECFVLSLLLLLSCARPTTSTDAPRQAAQAEAAAAPGVATDKQAVPPIPGDVPGALGPGLPGLAGSTEPMVIEGLTRSIITFTLGADLSPLGRIDSAEAAMAATHLEAHPRFRVTRWEGATMAMLRVDDAALGRTVPWGGYHAADDGGVDSRWRAALRLRPRAPGAEWTDSPLVDRYEPQDAVLKIHAFQPLGESTYDWRAAAVEVRGKELVLELHELSEDLSLQAISTAIKFITTDLLSLDRFYDQNDLSVQPWGWLPPGEPTRDAKGLYLATTDAGLDVRGRLNPGAAGWTWVRITDGRGYPWLEELTAAATLERIGWATDPDQSFWFQGRVPTDTPLPPGAVVEAWFLADGDSAPVQVGRWSAG